MASSSSYNEARWTRQFLKRHRKLPPSLVVHLYTAHFRFEQHPGNFTYDSPMKCFLEAIREQKLPTDLLNLLDEANVRYYEGCLIVEVHDHRSAPPPVALPRPGFSLFQSSHAREPPAASKAELFRIVLAPSPATLWTQLGIQENKDIELRSRPWTEDEVLEVESAVLARTSAPLCLSPSIQTCRIANMMQLATAARPHKRKRFCGSADSDDVDAGEEVERKDREEHERLMKIGEETVTRNKGNPFARLKFIETNREAQSKLAAEARLLQSSAPVTNPPPAPATSSGTTIRLAGPSAAGLVSGASTPAAPSPAPTLLSTTSKPSKKKVSLSHIDLEGSIPPPKKLSKKAQAAALAAGLSLDPNDPTLPSDPVEKERVLKERKLAVSVKKKADAKKQKEKKAQAAAEAQMGGSGGVGDLQVAPTPTPSATPGARFVWNGGGGQ